MKNDINSSHLSLHYGSPAIDSHEGWESYGLPIGNGYMGAMIFGGIASERIQFNEKTLWTGGPAEGRDYTFGNLPEKQGLIDRVREIFEENDEEGARVVAEGLTGLVPNEENGFGAYQSFGDIRMEFPFEEGDVSDYCRSLCLNNGVATVDFRQGDNKKYHREYFMSYPHRLLACKLSCSQGESLSFRIKFICAHGAVTTAEGKDTLVIRSSLADNGLLYEARLKICCKGGSLTIKDGIATVENCDNAVLYMTCGTDYENIYPTYRGKDPHDDIVVRLSDLSADKYDEIKEAHTKDHGLLFGRVALRLGDGENYDTLYTDELLQEYKDGKKSRYLETLLFQYGRYLLIASSRHGSLPANLQGVWNDSNTPAWNCDYHFNVNLQMNYWPSCSTALTECVPPLIEYIESLKKPGRKTAEIYTGVKGKDENDESGFMFHTFSNIFGWTAPAEAVAWGWTPGSAAWILQNIYDYYEYTLDKTILRDKIYPLLKEASKFWLSYLVFNKYTGRLEEIPAYSPEQWLGAYRGTTYSQELCWQLFTDTIKAAKELKTDEEFVRRLEECRDKLSPLHIGESGQIKEWYEETFLGSMGEPNHRHMSHLTGLFPGEHISQDTPDLLEAAKLSMTDRGDFSTGWSMANKINMWARTGDGNRTYTLINNLISCGILPNLFDTHPPFQIDGNFGFASGVTEMLMQSRYGYIEPLPSLPDAWDCGSVSGLLARGGFEVSLSWKKGNKAEITVVSTAGNVCRVKSHKYVLGEVLDEGGNAIDTHKKDGALCFDTEIGAKYTLHFSL